MPAARKIYVGNLPPDIRTRDVRDLFEKYGKIMDVDLKNSRGPPFAFVEFDNDRDADDAVRGRDGYNLDGYSIRVEFPRSAQDRYGRRDDRFGGRGGGFNRFGGGGGGRGGGNRGGPPSRRSDFRVEVTGLPPSGSWQDLKDHMREAGDVGYADVRNGIGVVEFLKYDDMKYAIKKLDDTKFKSHEGETSYVRVKEQSRGGGGSSSARKSRSPSRSRSRSRSPPARRRSSPTYSPMRGRDSRSRSYSNSRSRSRSKS